MVTYKKEREKLGAMYIQVEIIDVSSINKGFDLFAHITGIHSHWKWPEVSHVISRLTS